MSCLPMPPSLRYKRAVKVLKKYLFKSKRLIFRKVAILEPAILLKMLFVSQVIFSIFIELFRTIFLIKHLPEHVTQ